MIARHTIENKISTMKNLIFALLISVPCFAIAQGPRGGGEKMEAKKSCLVNNQIRPFCRRRKDFLANL